jgi:protein SCO1/2
MSLKAFAAGIYAKWTRGKINRWVSSPYQTQQKIFNNLIARAKNTAFGQDHNFKDISSPEDIRLPQRFAKFFHKDFKGVYLDKATLRDYTKEFSVFFAPSLMEDFEYEHTTNLYLVKKGLGSKKIKYVYNAFPYDFEQIELDIEELASE